VRLTSLTWIRSDVAQISNLLYRGLVVRVLFRKHQYHRARHSHAECNSAIQQVTNLRYEPSGTPGNRLMPIR
jgi:hypothetical protein